ncbi:MAG: iron chelate uptake ABC transporter family permease subunit [Rhodobacterales bacterium]
MFDQIFLLAALAGIGVALAAAPLGCFVVWRRMAYFGDATAHTAMLGVAISLIFFVNMFLSILIVALVMAYAVSTLTERGHTTDTLMGVLAHTALAAGIVAMSFTDQADVDLESFLFGDILTVTGADVAIIWIGAAFVLALVVWRWSALLTATLNTDLAYASGINPKREQLILTLALAIVVAVAIKVVGVLLISSMLIIPAATARPFSKTPEFMALMAMFIGAVSALGGLFVSTVWGTPTGPTMVCVAALLFIITNIVRAGKFAA